MFRVRSLIAAAAGLALVGLFAVTEARACEGHEMAHVKKITVDELAAWQKNKEALTVIDANNADTRTKFGVIPGAKLLSHYANYDVAKELPAAKDAKLVFYCGSAKCNAAPKAAYKAIEAGYTNVYVLEVGISGWAEAGKPTAKPNA